jgi:hypothetical protein
MRNGSNLLKFCLPLLAAIIVACPQNTPTTPPVDNTTPASDSTFKVDTTLAPISAPVAGSSFSSVKSASGAQADFIADELILGAPNRAAADAFVLRIGGSIQEVFGEPSSVGLYRVKISTPKGNVADLVAQLKRNSPRVRDDLTFSSDQAASLVALVAGENGQSGLTVNLNWVMQPLAEQSTATATEPPAPYTPNAREWPYMRNGGPLDVGVVGAWTRLKGSGNRTKVAVFDGGFRKSSDLPADTVVAPSDAYGRANKANCGNNPCQWHGLQTSTVLGGIEDNNLGVAGSAGRYASLRLVASPTNVTNFFEFLWALGKSIYLDYRVFNISANFDVPASLAWAAEGVWLVLRTAIDLIPGSTIPLIVASAGNNGLDVDRESCDPIFGAICWESVAVVPCEFDRVLCVGGTNGWASRDARHPSSAYGSDDESDSVDIFAPYQFWTLAANENNLDSNAVKNGQGTSFSAPFVSGVAAMVMAANPNLDGNQVRDIILRTAHPAGGQVRRFVNADAAVKDALGVQQPRVTGVLAGQATRNRGYLVSLLADGQVGLFGASANITAIDPGSREPSVGALTLNVTPPAGWAVDRVDAQTVQITPNADGDFTVEYSVVGQKTTTQSFSLRVQAPSAALIVHPGLGTGYVGAEYYATAKAYEETSPGSRTLIPCSQVKWEIKTSGGTQTVDSSIGGLNNCLFKTTFTQTQRLTLQAKVVDAADGSIIKQSASTVISVSDAPQGSDPSTIKLSSNALGAQTGAFPTFILYECGRFSDVTLRGSSSVFNADRVKHQIVNAASGGAQLTPAAEPNSYSNLKFPNPSQNTETLLTAAELTSLDLGGGTFPWYGRHAFSLFTLERDGMIFMRPAVIDVIPFCQPN